jgi:hypothetical protein
MLWRAMADRVRLIPWPETYEVRHPDGTRTFFRFDDENSLRRTLMGRTTKAEAIRRGVWVRRSPGRRQRSIQTKGPGRAARASQQWGGVDQAAGL